jgi:hypothetical protein
MALWMASAQFTASTTLGNSANAVADQFEHPTSMRRYLGIEDRAAVQLQPRKRARFVGLHKAAITHHIGGEDCG